MEKKNFSMLLLAAVLGSGITIGTYEFSKEDVSPIRIEHVDGTPSVNTNYSANNEAVPASFTEAADKVMNAVVHIRSTQTRNVSSNRDMRSIPDPFRDFFGPYLRDERGSRRPSVGSGSGVIISEEGHIVTNNHVIDQADDLEVTLYDNKSYKAMVIGTDPSTDLALIKIDEEELPHLALSNSDQARIGEWVLAVGNPFNLNSTVTAGIISAKGRNIGIIGDSTSIESFIQTDAAVNPGNSGGALVNMNGDLVGINTAIASPTGAYSGYSFAIPSNIVSKVVEDLITYGSVQRGWLGVTIQNVNTALANDQNLEVNAGAFVAGIAENSGAKDAGIKEGDVIVSVDGREIKTTANLIGYVGSKRPGDQISVLVNRNGNEQTFDITLKNRDGNTRIIKEEKAEVLLSLGIDLEELDNDTLDELDLSNGVKVKNIRPGKISKYTDMRKGFIITKIDGERVKTAQDVIDLLEEKSGGVLIEGIYGDGSGTYYYGLGM